jgi:hypothetical protein
MAIGDLAVLSGGVILSGDRCGDCIHCVAWTADYQRADCDYSASPMHFRPNFAPDQPVPPQCVGNMERKRKMFRLRNQAAGSGVRD